MDTIKEESSNSPLKLLSCRACLATDVNLYNIFHNKLADAFAHITGTPVYVTDGMPQHLCSYCRSALLKCGAFRDRSLRAQQCLKDRPLDQEITTDYIRSIDRTNHKLIYLTQTAVKTIDYQDLEIEFDKTKDNSTTKKVSDDLKEECKDLKVNIKKETSKADQDSELKVEFEIGDNTDTVQDDDTIDNVEHIFVETKSVRDVKGLRKRKAEQKRNPVRDVREGRKKAEKRVKKKIIKKRTSVNDYLPDFDFAKFESNYKVEIITLTKEQQLEEIQARKQSAIYRYSAYKCEECGKGFMAIDAYNNHKIRHSASMGPHACEICLVRFKRQCRRQEHQDLHRLKFVCKECSFVSRTRYQAKKHFETHSGKIYQCKYCEKTFTKSSSYLTHTRKKHREMNVVCECGETFVGRLGLLQHKARVHKIASVKPVTRCKECGAQFETTDALSRHIPCDPNTRPCLVCGESLPTEEELQAHSKERHSIDHLKCLLCDKTFENTKSYELHHQRVHLKLRLLETDSGARRDSDKPKGKTVSAICDICAKIYPSKAALVYHQRTHTGERPYKCSQCPKSFFVPHALITHQTIHSDERPFLCSVCPKAFKKKLSLTLHTRVHTGERPYKCSLCDSAFKQSPHLRIHIKLMHTLTHTQSEKKEKKLNKL